MKRHFIFSLLGHAVNVLLVTSILLTAYGALWEYSTRRYLSGFADAIVPYAASPEQKVQAILTWMQHEPARNTDSPAEDVEARDPEETLNHEKLLEVCGTATNAFVNLADSSGLESRRLLLLSPTGTANHVVAEVRIDGRWVIADPSFHALLKNAAGRLLTRQELADTNLLREATRNLPGYDLQYNYQSTAHVRLAAIPLIGRFLQRALDRVFPQWEESIDWTLLVERESFAVLVIGIALLLPGLLCRRLVTRHGMKRLGIAPTPLMRQLQQGGHALFGNG